MIVSHIMEQQIVCPSCGTKFELTAVMRQQLEAELRKSLQADHLRGIEEARAQTHAESVALVAAREAELSME